MIHILKKQNGMTIVGQGGNILLFMLPSLIAAVWLHPYFPRVAGRRAADSNMGLFHGFDLPVPRCHDVHRQRGTTTHDCFWQSL